MKEGRFTFGLGVVFMGFAIGLGAMGADQSYKIQIKNLFVQPS